MSRSTLDCPLPHNTVSCHAEVSRRSHLCRVPPGSGTAWSPQAAAAGAGAGACHSAPDLHHALQRLGLGITRSQAQDQLCSLKWQKQARVLPGTCAGLAQHLEHVYKLYKCRSQTLPHLLQGLSGA